MREHIGRDHPAEGVFIFRGQPTIAILTVCTRGREPRLANTRVHNALVASWQKADAWLVGFYLIMPDHIHLFCAPRDEACTIQDWIAFWKGQFRRLHADFVGGIGILPMIHGLEARATTVLSFAPIRCAQV
jgi:hypothetical protein